MPQYLLDHSDLVKKIISGKTEDGVEVDILLDAGNFYTPTTYLAPLRIKDLYDAGCRIRTRRPKFGKCPLMHIKAVIADFAEVLTGSCNMTHNGIDNNDEHVLLIGDVSAVQDIVTHFTELWNEGEAVGAKEIDQMMKAYDEHQRKRREQDAERERNLAIAAHAAKWHGDKC